MNIALRRSQTGLPDTPLPRPGRALLTARLRMGQNALSQAWRRRRAWTIMQGTILIGFTLGLGWGVFATSGVIFRMLDDTAAAAALAVILGGLLATSFVGNASIALQSLYLADDLPLLSTLPIPVRQIFGARFIEAMSGMAPLAPIIIAVEVGYGVVRAQSWLYPLAAVVMTLTLVVMMTALAVVLVAMIGRFLPARYARAVLGGIGVSVVLAIGLGVRWLTASPPPDGAAWAVAAPLAHLWSRLAWLPPGWAGRALVAGATGDLAPLVRYGGLATAVALLAWYVSFNIYVKTFPVSLARLQSATMPRVRSGDRSWGDQLLAPLPRQLGALIMKEWLSLGRDLRRLSGGLWPLGMAALYAATLGRGETTLDAGTSDWAFWLAVWPVALVPWMASLGLAIYAVGAERRNINLLRVLPVAPGTLLLAKVVAMAAPVLGVSAGGVVAIGLARHADLGQWAGLAMLAGVTSIGYVTIDTASSTIAPNFEAKHAQQETRLVGRVLSLAGGGLFTLATAIAVAALVLMTAGPSGLLGGMLRTPLIGGMPLGWVLVGLGGVAATVTVVLAFLVGRQEMERLLQRGE